MEKFNRSQVAGDCYHRGGRLSAKNSIALDSSTNVRLRTELVYAFLYLSQAREATRTLAFLFALKFTAYVVVGKERTL
jgi:hypothetical protein